MVAGSHLMATDRRSLDEQMREAGLNHLAGVVGGADQSSRASNAAMAEFTRRQTLALQEAAEAQKVAAQ